MLVASSLGSLPHSLRLYPFFGPTKIPAFSQSQFVFPYYLLLPTDRLLTMAIKRLCGQTRSF